MLTYIQALRKQPDSYWINFKDWVIWYWSRIEYQVYSDRSINDDIRIDAMMIIAIEVNYNE